METSQKAANRTESREVGYPAKCKSAAAWEKHKDKTRRENPEVLFTDYTQHKEGRKKNNLIFFSDSVYIWKDSLCNNYAHVSSEGWTARQGWPSAHRHLLHQRKVHGPGEWSQPGVFWRGILLVKSWGEHQEDQCSLWQWRWWEPNRRTQPPCPSLPLPHPPAPPTN